MEQAPPFDCSTKPAERISQERNQTARHAVRVLMSGVPGRVEYVAQVMHDSVLYQARIAGVRV